MILSHAVSDGILCATAVLSLVWYRWQLTGELRTYLSITVTLIGVTALLGALRYAGFPELAASTDTAARLGETVGIAALALGFWSAMVAPVALLLGIGVLLAAFAVFLGVVSFDLSALSLLVQGAGILTLLVLAITRKPQHPSASTWLGVGLLLFTESMHILPAGIVLHQKFLGDGSTGCRKHDHR